MIPLLTPPPRSYVHLFWGGGGVKASLRIAAAVCGFGPWSQELFSCVWTPSTNGRGPVTKLRVRLLSPAPPI